jgi:hypothetical protein
MSSSFGSMLLSNVKCIFQYLLCDNGEFGDEQAASKQQLVD